MTIATIMTIAAIILGALFGFFRVEVLYTCLPGILASFSLWFIPQIKHDRPRTMKDYNLLLKFTKLNLHFLFNYFMVRVSLRFTDDIVFILQWPLTTKTRVTALLVVLGTDLLWKFLNLDREIGTKIVFANILTVVAAGFWATSTAWTLLQLLSFRLSIYLERIAGKTLLPLSIIFNFILLALKKSLPGITDYEYKEIDTSRTIRLLVLHRRLPCFYIRASLLHVSLDAAPPYEAMSYTWGNPQQTKEIRVNGRSFLTTVSAYNILSSRSSIWRTRTIWIDSICINQKNDKEKTQQVSLMRDIYHCCSRTIIWLGGLGTFNPSFSHFLIYHSVHYFKTHHANSTPVDKPMFLGRLLEMAHVDNFETIFTDSWFERVWVVQETVLPKTVHVLYGGQYYEWSTLERYASMYNMLVGHMFSRSDITDRHIRNAFRISRLRQSTLLQEPPTPTNDFLMSFGFEHSQKKVEKPLYLGNLLKEFVTYKASNDLDKVYGLLGLTCDESNQKIVTDYEKTPELLFTGVARYLILIGDIFNVLSMAGLGHHRKYKNLPSWAPDWTTPILGAEINFRGLNSDKPTYKASGRTEAQVSLHQNQILLQVAAIFLDEIVAMGDICPLEVDDGLPVFRNGHYYNFADLMTQFCWHSKLWSMAKAYGKPYMRTRATLQDAFWKTLSCDRYSTFQLADPSFRALYMYWFQLIDHWDEFSTRAFYKDTAFVLFAPKAENWPILRRQGGAQRRFCVTRSGYFVLVPPNTEMGDEIWVLLGASTPYVLRNGAHTKNFEAEIGGHTHELVGECYVDGMMDGEIFEKNLEVKHVILK